MIASIEIVGTKSHGSRERSYSVASLKIPSSNAHSWTSRGSGDYSLSRYYEDAATSRASKEI